MLTRYILGCFAVLNSKGFVYLFWVVTFGDELEHDVDG